MNGEEPTPDEIRRAEIEESVAELDRLHATILFWMMRGLEYHEIGPVLRDVGLEEKAWRKDWIETRVSEIYLDLGFDPKTHSKVKRPILERDYYPAIKALTNDDPENLKNFPLRYRKTKNAAQPSVDQQEKTKTHRPKSVDQTVDQPSDDRPKKEPKEPDYVEGKVVGEGEEEKKETPTPPRRILLPTIVFVVLTALVAGSVGFFLRGVPVSAAPTPSSFAPSDVPPASPTLALPTPSPEPAFTTSPEPTAPPTATTNTYLFSDNFNEGLNPVWTTVFGEPIVVNGKLTSTESTMISVGDPSWTDYQVSFDIDMPRTACALGDLSNAVGVRASSVDSMLIYVFSGCHGQWNNVVGGVWEPIPATYIDEFFADDSRHITIDVKGNQYSVHYNADLIVSLVSDDYPSGYVFIKIRPETLYDDFKVTPLD